MRIGSIITAIISFAVSVALIILCQSLTAGANELEGAESLSIILTFPLYIIFFGLLCGTTLTSLISSFTSIWSSYRWVMITGIILTFLSVALGVIDVLMIIELVKNF